MTSLRPAEDILKLAESQRSFDGFQRSNCFHTAAILASLYVLMCAVPAVTQAQSAGGSINGTARGDSRSAMPGGRISVKDGTTRQVRTDLPPPPGSSTRSSPPPATNELT